jgi:hypothetical protein
MDLSSVVPGLYRGVVDGGESGHCTARIEVRSVPGGCLAVDYEAVSERFGLQHVEHTLVSDVELHVAFTEAPGVTVLTRIQDGVFEAQGNPWMRVIVDFDGDQVTWAWHWSTDGSEPVERSRARCFRTAC